MGSIECIVTAEKGIYYGKMIENPDPTKPAIDMHKLYEKGTRVMIDEKDFVDFDEVNAGHNKAKGHLIEVSYRRVKKVESVHASTAEANVEAMRAEITAQVTAQVRAQIKAEVEAMAKGRK